MKKILEVTQFGDFDIRFNTDMDFVKHPEALPDITSAAAFAMTTKLWGGNENSVIAAIRALAIADIACCAHPEEILGGIGEAAKSLSQAMREARKHFERNGGTVAVFYPGVPSSPKPKS